MFEKVPAADGADASASDAAMPLLVGVEMPRALARPPMVGMRLRRGCRRCCWWCGRKARHP